jgi:hypothetical protein
MMRKRFAASLIEVVLGAIVLGLSGVTVMELTRSNTVNVQITEVEAIARGLAGDLMERFSRRSTYTSLTMSKLLEKMQGVPLGWRDVVDADPALSYQLPIEDVKKLLDLYTVKLLVQFKPVEDPTFGENPRIRQLIVEVQWNDPRFHGAGGTELKKVEYAALVP